MLLLLLPAGFSADVNGGQAAAFSRPPTRSRARTTNTSVTIDFERFPGPDGILGTADDTFPACDTQGTCELLSNQFASMGIMFTRGLLEQGGLFPGSGLSNHFVSSSPPDATFSVPVTGISITSYSLWAATLYALDEADNVIASNTLMNPQAGSSFLLGTLSVSTSGPIHRFTVLPAGCQIGGSMCAPILNLDNLVLATSVIDQQQLIIDSSAGTAAIGGPSTEKLAQVVTAGLSGLLTEVRLPVTCDPASDLILEIQGVTAGTPNGIVLTSQTIPGSILPPFFPSPPSFRGLSFSAPVSFSAGSQFAIVLRSAGSCGVFQGPVGDSYLGGNLYFDALPNSPGWVCVCSFVGARFDLPFQTLVGPAPAPTNTPTNTPPTNTPTNTATPASVSVSTLNERGILIFGLLIAGAGLLLLRRR